MSWPNQLILVGHAVDGAAMITSPPPPAALRLENRHTGEVLEIRRLKRNGEVVFGLRGTLPAHREGPPLHIHHLEDEEGLIIGGTLSAVVGGRT